MQKLVQNLHQTEWTHQKSTAKIGDVKHQNFWFKKVMKVPEVVWEEWEKWRWTADIYSFKQMVDLSGERMDAMGAGLTWI